MKNYGHDPDGERVWLELAALITQGRAYGKFDDEGYIIYIADVHGGVEDAEPIHVIAEAECWPSDWREQLQNYLNDLEGD
jgi:hypothetical protein